jgi:hypothetical protein
MNVVGVGSCSEDCPGSVADSLKTIVMSGRYYHPFGIVRGGTAQIRWSRTAYNGLYFTSVPGVYEGEPRLPKSPPEPANCEILQV